MSAYQEILDNLERNGRPPDKAENPRPRYVVRNAEFALQPQPALLWYLRKHYSPGSVSLMVGPFGIGKTYVILFQAICVALGKDCLGHETKQTKVLIIDEESGERRLARRMSEVLRGMNADKTTPIEFVSLAQFNLRDSADALLLQALIEERGAGLVFIDALTEIMPGADENSVKDVAPVFMNLRKIAEETQAALVIIHHSNKMGDYRGSSAMGGAVDLMLMLDSKKGSNIIEFETKKTRDVEPFKYAAQIHFEGDAVWLSEAESESSKLKLGKAQLYVLRYLSENGAAYITEITSHADSCSERSARNAVYNLTDLGLTKRIDSGGLGEKATYDLTPTGKEYARMTGQLS